MKDWGNLAWATVLALALTVAAAGEARAYIDPGTGGMLLQLLVGGVAGALVVLKLYWRRFKAGVERVLGRERTDLPKAPE